MTSIPPSSDLPNMHDHLGTKQDAQFLLTDATKQAIAQTGYHVEGSKGRGGFGATYEVKHQESGARAIAKVMLDPKDEHHRKHHLKAFQRECRVLASEYVPGDLVPHYITHIENAGVQPFVLMEFIDGTEIHKYVSQPHRLDLDRRIEIVEKLFRAYQRLHDCHIVHGDPSPRNTLVQSGDRIRFIDFGSACRLDQGFGTLGTVSLKGITPGYGDDDILINGKRPDRWTDLYAAAAIAFQVLTDQPPPRDDSAWERVLTDAQVPRDVINVILKARRKRDERQNQPDTIDPLVFKTAGEAADAIDAWRNDRDATIREEAFRLRRGQQRRKHVLVSAVLLLIVGTIGAVGWWKYDHERQVGDRRALEDLRRQVEPLANANHPGVARFISEATGEGVSVKRAIALLTQARAASRDIEWAESMRQSLGDVLNDSPWLVSAKAIQERKDALANRFLKLKDDLEAGQTDDLQPRFAELHRDLARLAHDNTEAAPAEQRRIEFDRLANSVDPQVREKDGYVQIARSARDDAQRLLDKGQWHDAGLQFGSCTQRLTEWLDDPKNETAEQRAARKRNDRETLAAVQREKEQLQGDVERIERIVADKTAEIARLNAQFTKLTTERLEDRQHLKDTTAALATANATVAAQKKVIEVESPKLSQALSDLERKGLEAKTLNVQLTTLETANKQLTADAKGFAELKVAQGTTIKELAAAQSQLTALKRDLAAAQKQSKPGDVDPGNIKPGDEKVLTIDGIDLAFVWIPRPTGKFKMGTPTGETGHQGDETQVDVTLSHGYWMLKTEVTQAMYSAFLKQPPWKGQTYVKEGPKYPASYVSWNDAKAWCEKATTEARKKGQLTAKEKIVLPTEAQWEWAARGGTTMAYFFGNDDLKLGDYAWYDKNAWDSGETYAHEVGKKKRFIRQIRAED